MKSIVALIGLLLLASVPIVSAGTRKCRILALEGGGDKGAYEAGVFSYMANHLPPEEVQYDVLTGVSVGALNAAGLSQ